MHTTSIALMMEAVRTSEVSVNFNVTTRRYISEDPKLQTKSQYIKGLKWLGECPVVGYCEEGNLCTP
jgi:hypothetical protein